MKEIKVQKGTEKERNRGMRRGNAAKKEREGEKKTK